jgi:hypothetical protein
MKSELSRRYLQSLNSHWLEKHPELAGNATDPGNRKKYILAHNPVGGKFLRSLVTVATATKLNAGTAYLI